ncbi:MAG: hypothetical protein H6686_09410 [Fibrobacteria bacterium]|nr:hypothetical protein [Fibrobacteria bacterium]
MKTFSALAALLVLGACNVYNPSGKGDPDDTKGWIEQGNAQLRAQEFDAAQESFGHVLASDSGNNEAWAGYAKAVSAQHLDIGFLLEEVLKSQEENRKPLWDLDWAGKERAFQSITPVWKVLDRWAVLDSQGRAKLPEERRLERGLLTMAHSMLSLWDANGDGHLDSTQDAMAQLLFGGLESVMSGSQKGGGFVPAVSADMFYGPDSTIDSAKVMEFNAMLTRVDDQFRTVSLIAQQDTAMAAMYASVQEQNPEALQVYQTSNVVDDDMDGCADEEIIDSLDNDGDGLVDEDTRTGYLLPGSPKAGALAQVSKSDSVRGDRLANPFTGLGMKGVDSTFKTLVYADAAGHLEIHRPYWDPKTNEFPRWKWNYQCKWDAKTAKLYGVTASCHLDAKGKAPYFDTAGIDRMALAELLRNTAPGWPRVELGCKVIGGCWCRIQETLCDSTKKECRDVR